jgi:hypothetical protein
MSNSSTQASQSSHPSHIAIEQAFSNSGLLAEFNAERGYYHTELVQSEGDPPVLLVVENDPHVPEVVCFAYLPGDKLPVTNRKAILEFAARANVRLGRGFFKIVDSDDGLSVCCVVSLDYEEAELMPSVVSDMVGYGSNQMFSYAEAFRKVAGAMSPEDALASLAEDAPDTDRPADVVASKPSVADHKVCQGCGTTNPVSGKFCIECGKPLSNLCVKCKTENEFGARFCFNCGIRLGA